ncbi:helix-turn-helix transcriptional regulator [Kitasatospora sp. NPDC127121]|uniref:helix-turn-helix transcriptional regulator n=1 Tax=Kitasatospora sp. NPDC127121 TaxID=3345371 RepID=UPI003635BE45
MTRWGRLAVLRRAAGYTQEQLATAMDVDRTTIHRWENGKATPRPWQMPRLARLLKASQDELRSAVFGNPDADCAPRSGAEVERGESAAAALSLPGPGTTWKGAASELGDVGPRLATVDALIGDWASVNSKAPAPALSLRVTEEDVVVAEGMLGMFRQLDHTHGARQHWQQVSSYIDTELEGLLRRPAVDEQVARQRAQLTVGFCELAGYQAVDIGNPDRALEYYQRALALTTATGDQAYGAYLVAVNLGHLALHRGTPETALRWASSARAAAGTAASPATRAAITAVVARASARMLRESEATRLILEAEKLLEAASMEDEPTWIRYFTHAYLADEAAHCLHDLGRAPDARIQLADALGGVGKDKVRRRAIDAALLAATWLRSGDVDQACAVGRDAVVYAARTGSGRCVERVASILADLQTHADYVAVRELREFARAVLPDADKLAVTLAGGS